MRMTVYWCEWLYAYAYDSALAVCRFFCCEKSDWKGLYGQIWPHYDVLTLNDNDCKLLLLLVILTAHNA